MRLNSFNLTGILKRTESLRTDRAFVPFIGVELSGDTFYEFAELLAKRLPKHVNSEALRQSILPLAGKELTVEIFDETMWRIVGNMRRLRGGVAAPPWTRQVKDEWVPLQILSCEQQRNKYDKVGGWFQMRIMAGSPCPLLVQQFWSREQCQVFSRRFGFTSLKGHYPMRHYSELVNLRCYGLVSAEKSLRRPVIEQFAAAGAVVDYNRQIIRYRARVDFVCPMKYTHQCYQCPVGYDQCPAAVHFRTFEPGQCKSCDHETWFDPESRSEVCVRCTLRAALRPKQKEST